MMVCMKGYNNHVPFERGTDDADKGIELMVDLQDLLEIVSGLENEKCVTTSQTAARKCEDWARAESLRNASLGNLTTADNQLIKSYKVVELESSSAKMQPANNSPAEIYRNLRSSAERLKQRMKMKAQRELHKENRKNRILELKAEHAKQHHVIELQKLEHARQQQAIELQKLELQTRVSKALFTIIQERQNQGNH
jgi:predicted RNase H-like nuclease (RuvC/YqgF family)